MAGLATGQTSARAAQWRGSKAPSTVTAVLPSGVGAKLQRLAAEANGPAAPSSRYASERPGSYSVSVSVTSLRPRSGRGRRQRRDVPTRTSAVSRSQWATERVQRCSVPKSPSTRHTSSGDASTTREVEKRSVTGIAPCSGGDVDDVVPADDDHLALGGGLLGGAHVVDLVDGLEHEVEVRVVVAVQRAPVLALAAEVDDDALVEAGVEDVQGALLRHDAAQAPARYMVLATGVALRVPPALRGRWGYAAAGR